MDDKELEEIENKLENTEFNHDEDDLLQIRERLENVEFNNEEEDQEVLEDDDNYEVKISPIEKKEEGELEILDIDSNSSVLEKKGNKIIILLCIIIVILIIIIGFLLLSKVIGKGSIIPSNHSSEETFEDEGKPTTPIIPISEGKSSFINDNHLFVNYKDVGYITNLEGKVLYQDDDKVCSMMKDSYFMCERNYDSKTKYVIKKIDDSGTISNVLEEENFDSDGRILRSGSKIIGYYSENKDGTHLAFIDNNSIKEIDIPSLYFLQSSDSNTRKVYGGKYIVVSDKMNNSLSDGKKYSYGVYDIGDNKSIIKPKYETMVYLTDDLFVAVKGGKSGIVDSNDSIKLDFKYDVILYSNGLFFVGNGDTLHVLNKNYKEIGNAITISSLKEYDYYESHKPIDVKACGDKVILLKNSSRSGDNQYILVDQEGNFTDYDFQLYEVLKKHVITLKDKSLVLYDISFNKIQEFQIPDSIQIDLDTAVIYVEDNLVFNGCYVFDINSGKYLYKMNHLSRSFQGYYVDLNFQNGIGTADISLDERKIGSIDNVDVSEFLKADNNGIQVNSNYFIFHVDDKTLVLKRS